jgi:hypothetical protein
MGVFDLTHDQYALDPWRTLGFLGATLVAVVLAIRTTALAATALGIDASLTLYLGVALLVLTPPMAGLRLWSDGRFDHTAYRDTRDTRGIVRDHALGVAVALVVFAAEFVLLRELSQYLAGLFAVVVGAFLGVTATVGAAREYYDADAHPYYFALLDRLF